MSTTTGSSLIDLVYVGEPTTSENWLVSDWAAGQTSIMDWSPSNVVATADGSMQVVLSAAPAGSAYAYCGGEVQSCEVASTGTWTWTAQAPVMQDGAVFGLFTYKADWQNDPWLEFDFEFVGADTTQVRLNIHMETATGEHITLEQANGGPVIVDLGFDASQGLHTYDITVTETEAIFLVDGQVVGRFGAADMPYGTWNTGEMKGFANLWCVDPSLESWAGDWAYGGTPLTATITDIDVRPGDLGVFDPAAPLALNGDEAANDLAGGAGADILNGFGGADTLTGGDSDDKLYGGTGEDVLVLDVGNDLLEGGSGRDWVKVGGMLGATIDLATTAAQDTGYGLDRIQSIQNAWGGVGADWLLGNAGANTLRGEDGDDTLLGRAGSDQLEGRAGQDDLEGGSGNDVLSGGEGDDTLRLDAGDDTLDGGTGLDWIRISGSTAVTVDLARTTSQATGYGSDTILNVENVEGALSADKLYGDGGGNVLVGNSGNDLLQGRGGADRLVGGGGQDTFYGGVDGVRDVFVFNASSESAVGTKRDVIYDVVSGIDGIDLSGIDARSDLSGDQAFLFSGTTAKAFSVWCSTSRGDLYVRADVTGDKTADFEVRVVGVASLTSHDFVL